MESDEELRKVMRRLFPHAKFEDVDLLIELFRQYADAVSEHETGSDAAR